MILSFDCEGIKQTNNLYIPNELGIYEIDGKNKYKHHIVFDRNTWNKYGKNKLLYAKTNLNVKFRFKTISYLKKTLRDKFKTCTTILVYNKSLESKIINTLHENGNNKIIDIYNVLYQLGYNFTLREALSFFKIPYIKDNLHNPICDAIYTYDLYILLINKNELKYLFLSKYQKDLLDIIHGNNITSILELKEHIGNTYFPKLEHMCSELSQLNLL